MEDFAEEGDRKSSSRPGRSGLTRLQQVAHTGLDHALGTSKLSSNLQEAVNHAVKMALQIRAIDEQVAAGAAGHASVASSVAGSSSAAAPSSAAVATASSSVAAAAASSPAAVSSSVASAPGAREASPRKRKRKHNPKKKQVNRSESTAEVAPDTKQNIKVICKHTHTQSHAYIPIDHNMNVQCVLTPPASHSHTLVCT